MIFDNLDFFSLKNISKIKLFLQIFKTFLLILLVYCCSTVYAEIHIDITTGINSHRLIAIISFENNKKITSNTNNISDIIASDLKNSGKYHPIPSSKFPEEIKNLSDISSEKWLKIGINILLIGSINEKDNDQYLISYQLINISHDSKKIILQNQYTISNQWIRYVAHSISNDIFEKTIGIRGAFCTKIAYITHDINDGESSYKLYISDYDGYNEILVYYSKEPLMSPTWDPSGNQLVYVTFKNHRSMLVIHDLKKGIIRQLINFPRHNGAPAFSSDGKKLAFVLSKTGSLNLYVMDLISNKIQQITNERSNNTEPSWFPDNRTLAYTSDRSGTPQIYKIDTENVGNLSQRLSWSNLSNQNGHISSDGTFLIMTSRNNDEQNISKLNLLTGEHHILTNGRLDETSTLAPNDGMIIYNTSEGSGFKLYLLSLDSSHKIHLDLHHKEIRFPAWSSYMD